MIDLVVRAQTVASCQSRLQNRQCKPALTTRTQQRIGGKQRLHCAHRRTVTLRSQYCPQLCSQKRQTRGIECGGTDPFDRPGNLENLACVAQLQSKAATNHHAFQQRIAGQAIGAVDAVAGDLADGVKAGQGAAAIQIGRNAAHMKVRDRHHRNCLPARVDAARLAGGEDAGKTLRPLGADDAGIELHRSALSSSLDRMPISSAIRTIQPSIGFE